MPADIGRIEAHQVDWSGVDGIKSETPIKLSPCDSLSEGHTVLPLKNEYSEARERSYATTFLCPDDPLVDMRVGGDYRTKDFQYVRVRLVACSENCQSQTYINQNLRGPRISLQESSVNYGDDFTTENALSWSINNRLSLDFDQGHTWKQDVFLSQSEVYFEDKKQARQINLVQLYLHEDYRWQIFPPLVHA